jgi:hypothetical protein
MENEVRGAVRNWPSNRARKETVVFWPNGAQTQRLASEDRITRQGTRRKGAEKTSCETA